MFDSNPETAAALGLLTFVAFTCALLAGLLRMLARAVALYRRKRRLSLILIRDLIFFGGLGLDFALILFVRGAGLAEAAAGSVVWSAITGGVALLAVSTFAAFELFIIGRVIELPDDDELRRDVA